MSSFVYVIMTNTGEVKVGWSSAPYARLSKVKQEYSKRRGFTDAYLVGFVNTDYGFIVESEAHKLLDNYAVGGEWYKVNPFAALKAVVKAAQQYENIVVVETVGPPVKKPSVKVLRKLIKKTRKK